jgi:UDP-N-acetylglucosamine 2-epimerase (non-hydrolysing)
VKGWRLRRRPASDPFSLPYVELPVPQENVPPATPTRGAAGDGGPLRVLVLYGTRPEAIKMAPVIAAIRRRPDRLAVLVCTTAQHREMVDQVQDLFGLVPDLDLDLMQPGQTLNEVLSRAVTGIDAVLAAQRPDWLLVQGDTTTAMAGALAGFHRGVAVGHVEAGLRTGDLAQPFPEEANRRLIDVVARALFAPTERARDALLAEGVPAARVHLTGNTVVDALREVAGRLPPATGAGADILLTVHRRESFGAPLAEVFAAVRELAQRFPDVRWVYPVHPNPNVRALAHERLGGLGNVELHEPFGYLELLRRLRDCRFVLTDSGGLQEEAPSFGKPVLVLRETTERSEGVEAGVARLVGTDRARIVGEVTRLLTDAAAAELMRADANPYGDGFAAERIAARLAGEAWQPWVPAAAVRAATPAG